MQGWQFKELWKIRFLRILNLEKESNAFYIRLLKQNKLVLEDADIRFLLEQIMEGRGKRTRIARDLVHMVQAKEAEKESL